MTNFSGKTSLSINLLGTARGLLVVVNDSHFFFLDHILAYLVCAIPIFLQILYIFYGLGEKVHHSIIFYYLGWHSPTLEKKKLNT